MYCPKCNKTIPDDRVEEISRRLAEQFKSDALVKGNCPVCGTRLMTPKKRD
jgi:hypothetical protein